MPDEALGPDRLIPKGLPTGRHGYDKKAVERLLEQARRAWSSLEGEQHRLLEEIERAGGLEYLARDLGAVGGEVGRILGDAQEASRGLRERARADSVERVKAAAAEARRLVAEAEEQAFRLRSDAWVSGVDWLRQAEEAARGLIGEAEAEVLVIRAGAEQEAYRLIAGARREAQDVVRAARFEAERSVIEVRAQVEQVMPVEIPVTVPAPAEPPEAAPAPAPRRLRRRQQPEVPAAAQAQIRVIAPATSRRPAPGVDPGAYGDDLAAEVQALWESGEVEAVPVEGPAPAIRPRPPAGEAAGAGESVAGSAAPEETEPARPEAPGPASEAPAEAPVEEAPAEEAPAGEAAGLEVVTTQAPVSPEAAAELPAHVAPEEVASGPAHPEGLVDDLFARLRGRARRRAPRPEARPVPVPKAPAGPAPPLAAPAAPPAPDALELRDRLLLPIQNRALRGVKDGILELQNVALDALRKAGAWDGPAAVLRALAPALDPAAEEAAEAGARAVAAFTGGEAPAPVIGSHSAALAEAMAGGLAAQAAAASGISAGPLEVAASVSRVFRAWRADEAERWVRTIAYAAYHHSLLAGLAVAGVGQVAGVAHGLLCAECPALRGEPWDPAGNPPAGTARPPAQVGCTCTVAPRSSR